MSLTLANKITILRILAVPFFIATLLYYTPEREYLRYTALGIFSFAVISDVIDGYIARTRYQKTPAGAILDPLADKLLLISAFICLYLERGQFGPVVAPLWLVVSVISRDVILLLGSTIIFLATGKLDIEPSKWGKATTFLQTFSIFGLLLQWPISSGIWLLTVTFTLVSGIGYIRNGIKVINTAQ